MSGSGSSIRIRGVRQNNLKGLDLDIPLGKLTVVTGLSGTGKSSLVFETLHAEGQRRYVETFSAYTRQFMEMMDKPKVDSIENIRPSIAIQQSNNVKTSRSTVGTMTELCDFFKVWFCHVAELFDPKTGVKIEADSAQSIFGKALEAYGGQTVLVAFTIHKPKQLAWKQILQSLQAQGYVRCLHGGKVCRIEDLDAGELADEFIEVIQDRVVLEEASLQRFVESATLALEHGRGTLFLATLEGERLEGYSAGLHNPETGERFSNATPNLFSFNSPIGACPNCKGFGRDTEIDMRKVIPDTGKSIAQGCIRPFHGDVFGQCLKELLRFAPGEGVPTDVPWEKLTKAQQDWVVRGDAEYSDTTDWDMQSNQPRRWYGIENFFKWIEKQIYKAHMRFVLSRYRSYTVCQACDGARLCPDALNWKWEGYTLPDLYKMPIEDLHALLAPLKGKKTGNHPIDLTIEAITTRLGYLNAIGLGYLTLDRTSRTLSGGEVERVNLTTCLGTSLVETLFVLDEPSIGLHSSDIDRLVKILKNLVALGNTVVVVEHDESVMRAADHVLELGPKPGHEGGELVFAGHPAILAKSKESITGAYLSGAKDIDLPEARRPVNAKTLKISLKGVSLHNIQGLDVEIPVNRFVCLCGVSGSGKSTLAASALYPALAPTAEHEEIADIKKVTCGQEFSEVVLIDQSPVTRTPRSNTALFLDIWTPIRQHFGSSMEAQDWGLNASHFSFNSGKGRCEHCEGLGYERVEMQFLSDVFVPCSACEGKRFQDRVLRVHWNGLSIAEVLELTVEQAREFFADYPNIKAPLQDLIAVGLGYLTLGQPLNTLSGGEAQRLKLIKYLSRLHAESGKPSLLLMDEPTTGLHRDDIRRLVAVLQQLVNQGHSLVVIEHQTDILKCADWLIEMGPEAGLKGGQIVAEGDPETIAQAKTLTAPFIAEALAGTPAMAHKVKQIEADYTPTTQLSIRGAREHNLKNIDVDIKLGGMTVLTGVSGSGKSSLAFDIVFAEGQRRFMESISAYARQFVEQLPRPDVDKIEGIAPTVAIEQRVTRGSRKSTVATVTEVAQFLRLLYAKIGIQHSPTTGEPVGTTSFDALWKRLEDKLFEIAPSNPKHLYLCAPVVKARKGHHQPVATWAKKHGYELLRVDGKLTFTQNFQKLSRYQEHDIEVVLADIGTQGTVTEAYERKSVFKEALSVGKGACFIVDTKGDTVVFFSMERTDADSGESFPELDPKHFSWNSPRGWCEDCRGHGLIEEWMQGNSDYRKALGGLGKGVQLPAACPSCEGTRLNPVSNAVKLYSKVGEKVSLPDMLAMPASGLLEALNGLDLDERSAQIAQEVVPEIRERLAFMDEVGLGYLNLNRSSNTLSGGEAQRIRLAAQLSSNLCGVLYVLDEPSIGLHARDNARLIESMQKLKERGNTLLVVEHNEETMRAADTILDLGPGAGVHGGEIIAQGSVDELRKNADSLTGQFLEKAIAHPLRGEYRELPEAFKPRGKEPQPWLVLQGAGLRNLKGVDLRIPLERLCVVCGISGAGKSTLVRDVLKPACEEAIEKKADKLAGKDCKGLPEGSFKALIGATQFRKVIEVDQEPIGKTIRSTPATYIGAFDIIRDTFANLPDSKINGLTKSHFSFNTGKGRCPECKGAGRIKLEMNFLPDTYVDCEACGGSRYAPEMAPIRWNGKNIAEVLEMSFEEAGEFFSFHSKLSDMMALMVETGLGYLKLGQASPTLSGGEAQRLKLVSELIRGLPSFKDKNLGTKIQNLYILEEPTIGLHLSDCERLIQLLHRLVDQGHTVVVIEHHLEILREADYLVEVGPEGGEAGGRILYQGCVKGLQGVPESPTRSFV